MKPNDTHGVPEPDADRRERIKTACGEVFGWESKDGVLGASMPGLPETVPNSAYPAGGVDSSNEKKESGK